jgi:hypothetical protein
VNPGDETVSVVGYAPTTRSSAATAINDPSADVGAGGEAELTLDVSLDCGRAAPLLLPDLLIREQDGGRRAVPAIGSEEALSTLCSQGPVAAHPLSVTGVRRDGSALYVSIAAPSNRKTVITAVSAAGIGLDTGPLPLRVDRLGTDLRILPPGGCPGSWKRDGIPAVLDLEVEGSGPMIVELTLGTPLVQWVLDTSCGTS